MTQEPAATAWSGRARWRWRCTARSPRVWLLAIGADAALGVVALLVAVGAEMVVFFVAHDYVDVVGERYDHPERRLTERIAHGTRHAGRSCSAGSRSSSCSGSSVWPGSTTTTARPVLWSAWSSCCAFGYVAARRGQSSWGRSLLEGLVVALIGVGVLVLKLFLKESHRPYR